jgi:superfamily II DNA or RNA helicase
MTAPTLRPYQRAAVEAIVEARRAASSSKREGLLQRPSSSWSDA